MILYSFAKHVLRIAAHLYFVDIQTSGLEKIPTRSPVIIAANHPGSLLDAVLLTTQISRKIHYLAKSDFFRFPIVASLFHRLGVIPVYRPGKEPKHTERNVEAFEKAYEILESNGCIGIFPEGRNSPRRQVAELRTGAARMAMGAEARNHYRLGACVVPISVGLEGRELFLTSVYMSCEEPIRAADYAGMHQENPDGAIKKLTSDLQLALRRQAVHVEDLKLSQMVDDLSEILGHEPVPAGQERTAADSPSAAARWLKGLWDGFRQWFRPTPEVHKDLASGFRTRQEINEALSRIAAQEPQAVEDLHVEMEKYKDHLSQTRLRQEIRHSFDKPVKERLIRLRMTLYAVFMAPFALFGFLHNFLPYILTLFIARLFREEPMRIFAYFGVGIVVFSLTYLLYAILFWYYIKASVPWCLLYLVLVLGTGFASLRYRRKIVNYRDKILVRTLFYSQDNLRRLLQRKRREIIARFQELRQRYCQW